MSRDRRLGTLNVGRPQENSFTSAEVELLAQIALAVENAQAYRQIEELKDKLTEEKLYLEDEICTVYRFAEIIGSSQGIKNILRQVEIVAPADTGEEASGVRKGSAPQMLGGLRNSIIHLAKDVATAIPRLGNCFSHALDLLRLPQLE